MVSRCFTGFLSFSVFIRFVFGHKEFSEQRKRVRLTFICRGSDTKKAICCLRHDLFKKSGCFVSLTNVYVKLCVLKMEQKLKNIAIIRILVVLCVVVVVCLFVGTIIISTVFASFFVFEKTGSEFFGFTWRSVGTL